MITKQDLYFIQNYPIMERDIQMELDHLREKADIQSVQLDRISVQGGAQHDRMAEYVSRVDELEHRYMDALLNYKERYLKLVEMISTLPFRESEIIRLKYQKGYNWKRICRETNYSESRAQQIHREALKRMGM